MTKIRISASALARIEIDEKYLLGLNKWNRKRGVSVYTPYGGALEVNEGKPFLDSLGAEFEEEGHLRFYLNESRLHEFEAWFYQRIERETSIYRELKEELVDEDKALPNIPEDKVNLEYLTTTTERAHSHRAENGRRLTQRYFEITRATFTQEYSDILRAASRNQDSPTTLATRAEIEANRTENGIRIGTSCLPLIL